MSRKYSGDSKSLKKGTINEEDIDIWSDKDLRDLEKYQEEGEREYVIKAKLKMLRKKYFNKIKKIHALDEQLLLTNEFQSLRNENYLSGLVQSAKKIKRNKDEPAKGTKEYKILTEVDKENERLIDERKNKFYKKLNDEENQIERKATYKSKYERFWEKVLNFCKKYMPFKSEMMYIESHFNSTISLLFEMMRFLFVMGIISIVIFFYMLVYHLGTFRKNSGDLFGTRVKYGIPVFFLYSSFNAKEYKNYSITYGVWIIFFCFACLAFYYIYESNRYKIDIFLNTNRYGLLSSYVFTSWDFNIRNREKSEDEKKKITFNTQDYMKDIKKRIADNKGNSYFEEEVSSKEGVGLTILSYIIFVVSLVASFFLILLFFFLREGVRNKSKKTDGGYSVRNVFADLLPMMLFCAWILVHQYLCSLLGKLESWRTEKSRSISNYMKRLLSVAWNLMMYLFVQVYYILLSKTMKDSFMKMKMDGLGTFGCNGGSAKEPIYYNQYINQPRSDSKGYSRCREDEIGTNFLLVTSFYIVFYYIKEGFYCYILPCCVKKMKKVRYYPMFVLLHLFTEVILFALTTYYVPYFIVLLPFALYFDVQFQFYKLKNKANYHYDDVTLEKRNNQRILLWSFLVFTFLTIFGCLYFYLEKFHHENVLICHYTEGNAKELSYGYDIGRFCGPVGDGNPMSMPMTDGIKNNVFFGWFHTILSTPTVILLMLFLFICIAVFKNNSPDEVYYNFVTERHRKLLDNFHLAYEQLRKRDVITSILLHLSKKKDR